MGPTPEESLEILEREYREIQHGLSFPLNFADWERLMVRSNAVVDEARGVCQRFNIELPLWTRLAKRSAF